MATVERLQKSINKGNLESLAKIAEEEREAFFVRNPGQDAFYKDRFLAAALCQGAALHYLGRGTGVKDFDIHFFYEQHPIRKQMARAVRSVMVDVPDYARRQVDFIRTVVPSRFVAEGKGDIAEAIHRFLEAGPTQNARKLAEKAVIGLIPEPLFARVIWGEASPPPRAPGSAG